MKAERHGVVQHDNAFGFLRLLFASLVIAAHTPELIDGNRSRELLFQLTGTTTFGILAVNGFFLISGYLITASFEKSQSVASYLTKRVLRIYPAFIIASLLCLFIVGPLSGGYFSGSPAKNAALSLARIAVLARPKIDGAFPGQHQTMPFSALDAPMWTIQYEFACYLLVIALGLAGLLRHRFVIASLSVGLLILAAMLPDDIWGNPNLFPSPPQDAARLVGMFLAGAAFHKYRPAFKPWAIGGAGVLLAITIGVPALTHLGFALFGGYLIFTAADRATWAFPFNNKNDISYGVYLYAWPIEQLLIRYSGIGSPILLGISTLALAAMCGWASWLAVERPASLLKDRRVKVRAERGMAT